MFSIVAGGVKCVVGEPNDLVVRCLVRKAADQIIEKEGQEGADQASNAACILVDTVEENDVASMYGLCGARAAQRVVNQLWHEAVGMVQAGNIPSRKEAELFLSMDSKLVGNADQQGGLVLGLGSWSTFASRAMQGQPPALSTQPSFAAGGAGVGGAGGSKLSIFGAAMIAKQAVNAFGRNSMAGAMSNRASMAGGMMRQQSLAGGGARMSMAGGRMSMAGGGTLSTRTSMAGAGHRQSMNGRQSMAGGGGVAYAGACASGA
jgi:hypothetical protein